jgi:hypothetical protein
MDGNQSEVSVMAFSTSVLTTAQNSLFRDRSVNATGSFPTRIPTIASPTTATTATATSQRVFDLIAMGVSNSNLLVVPFGTGSATQTFSVRVIGWSDSRPVDGSSNVPLWIPRILCEYLCTLCTATGVANSAVLETEKFCDTVSLVSNRGTDGQDTTKASPGGNFIGSFLVDLKGCKEVELVYSVGTNTDCNALVQWL